MGKPRPVKRISGPIEGLKYEELVEVVRGNGREKRKNCAYNEIEKRIKVKIGYIVRQFFIPGHNSDDILQEALYALRFKAILDYDSSKGMRETPYPFDKFAMLCIRRHLATLLKSSFQLKRKTLNKSLSLDQDRGSNDGENLYLVDILTDSNKSLMEIIGKKEYHNNLMTMLCQKLSKLEKEVLALYVYKYSYEEITDRLNKAYKKRGSKKKINIKTIDNALSRLKMKGKEIFEKYEEEENSD